MSFAWSETNQVSSEAILSPTARSTRVQSRVPSQASQAANYTAELLSYSVERLRKEPELLDEERKQIERNQVCPRPCTRSKTLTLTPTDSSLLLISQLQSCTTNYTAFIDASSCLDSIHTELATVGRSLAELLRSVPLMANACEDFSQKSASLVEQFSANQQLSNTQASLMEVLELPHLMETCENA